MLSIEKITTTAGLTALRPVWNEVLESSAANTVTLTWEWITAWWHVFGADRELFVLVVRDGTAVVGIAPLLRRTVTNHRLPFQRLEFMASGEDEADEICSDYLDFILVRGREREALDAIFRYLCVTEPAWDEIVLAKLCQDSGNWPLLQRAAAKVGLTLEVTGQSESLYLPLPENTKDLSRGLSRSLQRRIERDRKVACTHSGEFSVIETPEAFESCFDDLICLHQRRWTARGERGVFASRKFARFHCLLAPSLLQRGWAKLFVLTLGGEPVSILYTFVYDGKVHYYQSGFSLGAGRLRSPGTLTFSYAMQWAIAQGLREWDFLEGERDGYKSRWGTQSRAMLEVRLAWRQPKETLHQTVACCIGGLRRLKRVLRKTASPSAVAASCSPG